MLELLAQFSRDPNQHTIVGRMLNLVLHQFPLISRNDDIFKKYQTTIRLLWQQPNLLMIHSCTLKRIVGMDCNSDSILCSLVEVMMLKTDFQIAAYIETVSSFILSRHCRCLDLLGSYAVCKHFSSRKTAMRCLTKAAMKDMSLFEACVKTILQKLSDVHVKTDFCLEALLDLARSSCLAFLALIAEHMNRLDRDGRVFIAVLHVIKIIAHDSNWTSNCVHTLNMNLQHESNLARQNAIQAIAFVCNKETTKNYTSVKTTLYFQDSVSTSEIQQSVLKEMARYLEHSSKDVQESAISAFKALKEVGVSKISIVQCVSNYLTNPSEQIRDMAVYGISQIISNSDTDCVHILFETMKNSSELQRKSIVRALSRILPETNIRDMSATLPKIESIYRVEIAFTLLSSPSTFLTDEKETFLGTLARVTGIAVERISLRDVTRVSPSITHEILAKSEHGPKTLGLNQSYWNSTKPNSRKRRGAAYGGAMTVRVECDILLNKNETCELLFDSDNLQQVLSEQGYIWLEVVRPASIASTNSTLISQTMMDLLQEEQSHHVIHDALKVLEAVVEQKHIGLKYM